MDGLRVLVCDPIHDDGVKILREAGYIVDLRPSITASALVEAVGAFDAIVVRSRTDVTARAYNENVRKHTHAK